MKDKIWIIIISLLAYFLSTYISYSYFKNASSNFKIHSPLSNNMSENSSQEENGEENSGEKTEICPLNGAYYSSSQKAKWAKRRPLGVMIENHTEARPQSGLSKADIVYEIVAEGGITRFLAIYYCQDASFVGPVRSARIYFIKLLQEYGNYPLYAHVGGANTPGPADALGEIRDLGWVNYNDLNQFSVPFPYFWRDYDRLPNRATEHTVYSSTTKLWDFAANKRHLTNVDEKGNKWDKNFTPWQFKDDASKAERGQINKVSYFFWESFAKDYQVEWKYDLNTNSYLRFNGGVKHIDKNTNKQIIAKNVVVIFAKESPANDGYPGGHLLYQIAGQGDGLVFQDGKFFKINWLKKSEESRMMFTNTTDGKVISFVRGPIWIAVLPLGNEVSY